MQQGRGVRGSTLGCWQLTGTLFTLESEEKELWGQ